MIAAWVEITAILSTGAVIVGAIAVTQRYNTEKRGRIYERLDEVKADFTKEMKSEYSRKDLCTVTHEQVEKELKEIKAQTTLIPTISAQLTVLINGGEK